jgi:pterin-4a-carbinolamine dehydratase
VWNTVVIDLTTHDAGGLTAADFALAREMERLADLRTK